MGTNKKSRMYMYIKRILDIIFSSIGIVLLFPVFIIISICIKIDSKGPVFFLHERVGKNEKYFKLWKFRTMVTNAEALIKNFTQEEKEEYYNNFKLKNDRRITKFGLFLRKTALDELPQLINILKGELSFVGPRPIINKELEKYKNKKEILLSVRPGLTGYWVANRKTNTTYEERTQMELYYVKNISLKTDIIIIIQTFINVIFGRSNT